MSSVILQEHETATPGAMRGFPAFRPLAQAALGANMPVAAWLLLTGCLWPAMSVVAGLALGMALYGSLHLFVGRGLSPFLAGVRGQSKPATGGMTLLFALLLPLKYLALGGLMWLFWRSGHLSLLWMTVGFLTAQAAVTVTAIVFLMRSVRA